MIIKKFQAKNSQEAEELAKKELGPEVMILTVKQIKENGFKGIFSQSKVEITAAVDEQDFDNYKSSENDDSSEEKLSNGLDIIDDDFYSLEENEDIADISENAKKATTYQQQQIATKKYDDVNDIKNQMQILSTNLINEFGKNVTKEREENKSKKDLSIDTNDSKEHFFKKNEIVNKIIRKGENFNIGNISKLLVSKGISPQFAIQLEKKINDHIKDKEFSYTILKRSAQLNFLKQLLASLIETKNFPEIFSSTYSATAVIGSSGVGKSTILAKIINGSSKFSKIQVIDVNFGVEKSFKLATLCQNINVPITSTNDEDFIKDVVEESVAKNISIFVDSSGINYNNKEHVFKLNNILKSIPKINVLLTLSATTKDIDMYAIIKKLSLTNFESLAITKIDETVAMGNIFNIYQNSQKPISFLSMGSSVFDSVHMANSSKIAHIILTQNNNPEFKEFRKVITNEFLYNGTVVM